MATNDYSENVNNKIDEILDFVNKLPLNKDQRKKLVKKLDDDSFTIDFDKQYIEEKKSVDDIIDGIDGDSGSDAKPLDESDSDHSTDQDTDSENAVEEYLSLRSI
mgnify:CR=1 FL=1